MYMSKIWDTTPKNDRFESAFGQQTMKAIVTDSNGGYEKLECREVKIPKLELGEVLINVLAAGVNNTEINTRIGWYSSAVTSGGPLVSFDMRTFYLKDLTLIGCTGWDEPVFPNLVSYIEKDEIKPLVAKVFPLEKIAEVQKEFLEKKHVGNFVLIPPEV